MLAVIRILVVSALILTAPTSFATERSGLDSAGAIAATDGKPILIELYVDD